MASAPTPPPVPQAQNIIPQAQAVNLQTAQEQAKLNNVSQSGPMGGITYSKNPDGGYSLRQDLNPQVKGIIDQNLTKFQGQPGPVDPSGAVKEALSLEERYMDPYFQQQRQQTDSQLKNQGFVPGTEGYDNAMKAISDSQGNIVAGNVAQFEPIAYQQSWNNYNLPLQTAATAYGGLGFNPVTTPQTGVPATDAIGAYGTQGGLANQQYQQQTAQYDQMLAGLFSIPAAFAGNVGKAAAFSDRRLKEDVTQVGQLFDGTPIYRYRYVGFPTWQIGLMAQDVEQYEPEAVGEEYGYKVVDYHLATKRAVDARSSS